MAARLTRLLSPLRSCSRCASIISPACQPSPMFHRLLISGRDGLLKNWGKWWIQPDSLNALPLTFEFLKRKMFSQGFRLLFGKKLLIGSSVGFTIVNGIINDQSCTIYAWDDHQADSGAPSKHQKDGLHTIWVFMRKFQLPAVLVITVLSGWRHPLILAINIVLLLFSTRPNPLSVYMFIEQLHQRDLNRSTIWPKSKFVYKNVKVEDYKILCLATVEERNTKLHLLGILDGWWVVHTSKI